MADQTVLDEIAGERRTFADPGEWTASTAAEKWLRNGGYSVGRRQRGEPRGVLRGDWDIQKWRNLRKREREALDGVMTGDSRWSDEETPDAG